MHRTGAATQGLGVGVHRTGAATQGLGVGVHRAGAATQGLGVGVHRTGAATQGLGVGVHRTGAATQGLGVGVHRTGAATQGLGVGVHRTGAATQDLGVDVPSCETGPVAPLPQGRASHQYPSPSAISIICPLHTHFKVNKRSGLDNATAGAAHNCCWQAIVPLFAIGRTCNCKNVTLDNWSQIQSKNSQMISARQRGAVYRHPQTVRPVTGYRETLLSGVCRTTNQEMHNEYHCLQNCCFNMCKVTSIVLFFTLRVLDCFEGFFPKCFPNIVL